MRIHPSAGYAAQNDTAAHPTVRVTRTDLLTRTQDVQHHHSVPRVHEAAAAMPPVDRLLAIVDLFLESPTSRTNAFSGLQLTRHLLRTSWGAIPRFFAEQ